MAAKPKLSHEEWAKVRKAWESDPRDGYVWLIEEMSVPLTRAALRKVAIREGWTKNAIGKVSKNPVKVLDNNPGDSPDHCADKGSDKKVSSPKVSKVSKKLMVSKVSKATETIGDDQVREESKKNPGGRPTLYREDYAKQAYRLCLLGATDEEIAEAFDVSVDTIYEWKNVHAIFSESMKKGKVIADAKVAQSLYKRAIGYSHPETHVSNHKGEIIKTELVRHHPPDTGAAFIWLKNRQPARWRDKVEVGVNVKLDRDTLTQIEQVFMEKMARSRERQETILLERGITIEHGQD